MAKADGSEIPFKLKATKLEDEKKALVKNYQKIKEKTHELVCIRS